jgi:hypothetical protein
MCFRHSIVKDTKLDDMFIPAGRPIRAGINLKTGKELGLTMSLNSFASAEGVCELERFHIDRKQKPPQHTYIVALSCGNRIPPLPSQGQAFFF